MLIISVKHYEITVFLLSIEDFLPNLKIYHWKFERKVEIISNVLTKNTKPWLYEITHFIVLNLCFLLYFFVIVKEFSRALFIASFLSK